MRHSGVRSILAISLCALTVGCAASETVEGCGRGPSSRPLPTGRDLPLDVVVHEGLLDGIGDINGNWYTSPMESRRGTAPGAASVPAFRQVPDGRYRATLRVQKNDLIIITVGDVSAQLSGPLHCE